MRKVTCDICGSPFLEQHLSYMAGRDYIDFHGNIVKLSFSIVDPLTFEEKDVCHHCLHLYMRRIADAEARRIDHLAMAHGEGGG